jgi:hypothetical protein
MNKVKINFPEAETKEFSFYKQTIIVETFIDYEKEIKYIKEYIENLNKYSHFADGFIVAEKVLMSHIVEDLTNIEIGEDFDSNLVEKYVWKDIKNRIDNYDFFRMHLEDILSLIQKDQLSLSAIEEILNEAMNGFNELSKNINESVDFIRNSFAKLIDNFKDLNVEDLKNVINRFNNSLEDLNKQVPGLLTENQKEEKRKPGRPKKSE